MTCLSECVRARTTHPPWLGLWPASAAGACSGNTVRREDLVATATLSRRYDATVRFGLVGAPFYYPMLVTDTRPAAVPQVALNNGSKRVVFQGMQHIGSEKFYKAVIYDVEKALSEGYVVYEEGVLTPTPESKAFFEKLSHELGGGSNLSRTYKSIGEVCGMKFQLDYFGLLEADKAEHPKRHITADVDAFELKAEYERLMREDPAFAKADANDVQPKPPTNDNAVLQKVVEWLKNGTEAQRTLGGVACRADPPIRKNDRCQDEQSE